VTVAHGASGTARSSHIVGSERRPDDAGVAAWPLVARAQQGGRMRRIGVLMPFAENGPDAMAQLSGFMQGLAQLGWTDGRNVRMDLRWAVGSVDRTRMFAKELVEAITDALVHMLRKLFPSKEFKGAELHT
jgi:hypothetical protein